MDAQTIIMPNLLTLVRDYGKKLASNFLEGESAIGGTMDDELTEFLARRDVSWDSLTTEEQDAIRDSALESFKRECSRRIVGSDPSPSTSARDALLVECREALEPCVGHLRWAADPSMKPSKGVRQIYREQSDKIESLLSKLSSVQ